MGSKRRYQLNRTYPGHPHQPPATLRGASTSRLAKRRRPETLTQGATLSTEAGPRESNSSPQTASILPVVTAEQEHELREGADQHRQQQPVFVGDERWVKALETCPVFGEAYRRALSQAPTPVRVRIRGHDLSSSYVGRFSLSSTSEFNGSAFLR